MSSHIKRSRLAHAEEMTTTRVYQLRLWQPGKVRSVLLDVWTWKFIHDGIVTSQLQKALAAREVYLTHDTTHYLDLMDNERALAVFFGNDIFESEHAVQVFCEKETVEVIQSFTIEKVKHANY